MKINNFVYGDKNRIFVNTDMGCKANCRYCYLSSLGIEHGKRKINADQAIELVENLDYYVPGEKGSVISIGCYSECMDNDNVLDTLVLVKHFAKRGNFVQLATKKKIGRNFFETVAAGGNIKKNIWIYVSIPTITGYSVVEMGTDAPNERIKNFDLCQEYGINAVLYIKPYLDELTNKDIEHYCELTRKYSVPIVVGEMLSTEPTEKEVLIGEKRLYEKSNRNMEHFISQLKQNTKVFMHSVDCAKFYGGSSND